MKTFTPQNMKPLSTRLLGMAALLAVLPAASAAITYVDVNTTNTLQADGTGGYTTFTPATDAAGTGTDNLWRDRTGSTNPSLTTTTSNVRRYEASDAGTPNENAPRLQTSVGGFNAGDTVAVYAYFWGAPVVNQPWGLSAGLTDTALPLQHYVGTLNGGPPAGSLPATEISSVGGFANAAGITVLNSDLTSGNQRLMQISLGQTVIGGDGTLRVYLDDFANVDNTVRRSTLDGIGYEVIPEPSALMLGLLGLGALARRRR
jgi:hypothetical protein